MDSQMPRKRGRGPEALPDSSDVREPKRFEGEETNRFLDLLQLEKTLAEEEEECAVSEELVTRVMKNLEQEIAATCSTNSGDDSVASDICRHHDEGQILDSDAGVDFSYLLDVSDYKLGIPPSPVLELKVDEVCLSRKVTPAGLSENPADLKSLGENWDFEDNFEDYQQFAMYKDPWNASQLQDYMNTDL